MCETNGREAAGVGPLDWELICVINADGTDLVQVTQAWISLDLME